MWGFAGLSAGSSPCRFLPRTRVSVPSGSPLAAVLEVRLHLAPVLGPLDASRRFRFIPVGSEVISEDFERAVESAEGHGFVVARCLGPPFPQDRERFPPVTSILSHTGKKVKGFSEVSEKLFVLSAILNPLGRYRACLFFKAPDQISGDGRQSLDILGSNSRGKVCAQPLWRPLARLPRASLGGAGVRIPS